MKSNALFFILLPLFAYAQKWQNLATIPEKLTFPVCGVINGKVHYMGGGATGGATDRHYQYDPSTDTWSQKAKIPYKAQQPAGAARGTKFHYFGGGFPNSGTPLKDHYIYDATTDGWSKAADLVPARAIHYAITLNNEVYSMAGQGVLNRFEKFDDGNDAWIPRTNLPETKFLYGAHIATGNNIYKFCGGGYSAPTNTAFTYDWNTQAWSSLPGAPMAIHGIAGAAIGDNIYLIGGYADFEERKEIWVYNIPTKTYNKSPDVLPVGRDYHNVVAIDSCIYIFGGNHAIDQSVGTSALKYCPYNSVATQNPSKLNIRSQIINNTIIIQFLDGNPSDWNVEFINMVGANLKQGKINKGELEYKLAADDLVSGQYILRVYNAEQHHIQNFTLNFNK